MTCNGTLGLVLIFPLIDNLLEHKTAGAEDEDDWPDLEGGLGRRGVGVGRGFVGAGGLAWLAEAGEGGGGGGESAGCGAEGGAAREEGAGWERHGEGCWGMTVGVHSLGMQNGL